MEIETMKSFKEFCGKDIEGISDDVAVTVTNHMNFGGVWTVGLKSESTHGGYRLAGTPNAACFSQSRGRSGKPSNACMSDMIDHAKSISK